LKQRQAYEAGKLSAERLEAVGFIGLYAYVDSTWWDAAFMLLQAYHEATAPCRVAWQPTASCL